MLGRAALDPEDPQRRQAIATLVSSLPEGLGKLLRKARTGGQHARHYFERTPSDGIYLLARFRGRPATRFRVKGCLDAKSDGVAIRRADGAFCRNRYNVARGT